MKMQAFSCLIMARTKSKKSPDTLTVTVRFITIMQRYSERREVQMDVPSDPCQALALIIEQFRIPWRNKLEKSTRIFINRQFYEKFIANRQKLKAGDIIAFIPMSGGG